MKSRNATFVVIGLALTALISCGGGPTPETSTSESAADQRWLYGGEDVWIPMIDTLARELKTASAAVASKQPAAASAALREGAVFLESETEGLAPEGRAKFKDVAAKLTRLADSLDSGSTISVETFQTEMREAYVADVDYLWSTAGAEEWMPWVEEIQQHFEGARDHVRATRSQETATELRRAAALLRLEAGQIGGADKKVIEGSWFEVRQLAAKAQTGALTDVAKLERVAAHTDQNLAKAHRGEAERLWENRDPVASGGLLGLAAKEFDEGLVWFGVESDQETKDIVERAHRMADALGESPAPSEKEVSAVFDEFDRAITAFAENFVPQQTK